MKEISIRIQLPDPVRKRWEKLVYDRGYAKSSFLRSFIEAVTDPVRGPQIERVIQSGEPAAARLKQKSVRGEMPQTPHMEAGRNQIPASRKK